MTEIRHVGIYVDDIQKMKEFYMNHFGMKEIIHTIEQGNYIQTILGLPCDAVEVCKLQAVNGGILELLQVEIKQEKADYQPVWSLGKMHIAMTVDNVDNEYRRLRNMGIQFNSEPMISPDHYAKVCFCRDIEDNYLELVEVL